MDVLTPAQRSRNMRAIGSRDTKPELFVRRLLRTMALGYRLHVADLPGSPDVILGRLRTAIFVHGCFWHRHQCRLGRVEPATRVDFWRRKFAANVARDRRAVKALKRLRWRVVIVWECEARDPVKLRARLRRAC